MTAYPTISADEVGWLSESQMIEVDRVMIEDLGIELIQMMENAGRNLAQLVFNLFRPSSVQILAGSGGNGGGGLAAARHLANRGLLVSIALGKDPSSYAGVPGRQLDIADRMGIAIDQPLAKADVVVDALIGYSLSGAPRGRVAELIDYASSQHGITVALDTPSGLDVTTGSTPGPVVKADATLTLAVPKVGLRDSPEVGELYVGDISVPPGVYEAIDAGPAPDFTKSAILRIKDGVT
jgi:NAD(P)H-hydrate epimerase